MSESDSRQIARDSLFILADVRLDGLDVDHRVRVRNLSPGGMMGEGEVIVTRGTVVWVNLRNVGWVEGSVAWVQENRFGVAFNEEIDPKVVRASANPNPWPEAMVVTRPVLPPDPPKRGPFRKII